MLSWDSSRVRLFYSMTCSSLHLGGGGFKHVKQVSSQHPLPKVLDMHTTGKFCGAGVCEY